MNVTPISAGFLYVVDLCLDELVSDFSEGRKVGDFFLEHNQNHPLFRGTNSGGSLLPVVQAQVLKIVNILELEETGRSSILIDKGIMPLVRIWSLSIIRKRPLNFDNFL